MSNFSVTRNSVCEFHTLDWFPHVMQKRTLSRVSRGILTCVNLANSEKSECAASTKLLLLLLLPLLLLQRQRSLSLASMRLARPARPWLAFLSAGCIQVQALPCPLELPCGSRPHVATSASVSVIVFVLLYVFLCSGTMCNLVVSNLLVNHRHISREKKQPLPLERHKRTWPIQGRLASAVDASVEPATVTDGVVATRAPHTLSRGQSPPNNCKRSGWQLWLCVVCLSNCALPLSVLVLKRQQETGHNSTKGYCKRDWKRGRTHACQSARRKPSIGPLCTTSASGCLCAAARCHTSLRTRGAVAHPPCFVLHKSLACASARKVSSQPCRQLTLRSRQTPALHLHQCQFMHEVL